MHIWVDLSTAPDPLFFRPIVRRLHALGHTTWITARSYCETVDIAAQCGLSFETVGRHGGRTLRGKGAAILQRAAQLSCLVRRRAIDLAVSFNSYAQGLAASAQGIPFVTIADYEYQPANHLAFRLARKVIIPLGFDTRMLRRQGGGFDKAVFFEGLKEHITLIDFEADPEFRTALEPLGIHPDQVLIVMRPPATWSAYHRFENTLFDDAAVFFSQWKDTKVLMLPRYPSQTAYYQSLHLDNLVVSAQVLDGLNLISSADMVVSGGGSMNREAVVLGTPAFTVFRGKMAGVDKNMIARGQLTNVTSSGELRRIVPTKKHTRTLPAAAIGPDVISQVVDSILTTKCHSAG